MDSPTRRDCSKASSRGARGFLRTNFLTLHRCHHHPSSPLPCPSPPFTHTHVHEPTHTDAPSCGRGVWGSRGVRAERRRMAHRSRLVRTRAPSPSRRGQWKRGGGPRGGGGGGRCRRGFLTVREIWQPLACRGALSLRAVPEGRGRAGVGKVGWKGGRVSGVLLGERRLCGRRRRFCPPRPTRSSRI